MTPFESAREMKARMMAVAENVVFRKTQDLRAKDGRVRCSVDDLLMRLNAISPFDVVSPSNHIPSGGE